MEMILTSGQTASYVADLLGRRIGVVVGLFVIFIGTIIQVVPSVNRGMFIAGRFLVGFGYVYLNSYKFHR